MQERQGTREAIIETAVGLIGSDCIKYVPGHPELGQSPNGFDCSGFVSYVLLRAGLSIPNYLRLDSKIAPIRHTNEYFDHYGILVHDALRQAGDLVFFSNTGWGPTHVGIMVSPEDYVHAPGRDGEKVRRESCEELVVTPQEHTVHQQIYIKNPIGYKAPVRIHHDPSYRVHQEIV